MPPHRFPGIVIQQAVWLQGQGNDCVEPKRMTASDGQLTGSDSFLLTVKAGNPNVADD